MCAIKAQVRCVPERLGSCRGACSQARQCGSASPCTLQACMRSMRWPSAALLTYQYGAAVPNAAVSLSGWAATDAHAGGSASAAQLQALAPEHSQIHLCSSADVPRWCCSAQRKREPERLGSYRRTCSQLCSSQAGPQSLTCSQVCMHSMRQIFAALLTYQYGAAVPNGDVSLSGWAATDGPAASSAAAGPQQGPIPSLAHLLAPAAGKPAAAPELGQAHGATATLEFAKVRCVLISSCVQCSAEHVPTRVCAGQACPSSNCCGSLVPVQQGHTAGS